MRNDYLQSALKVIDDPNILVNVVSLRVKQLKYGTRPLITSLEKLAPEDVALREIAEGKITYELASEAELIPTPAKTLKNSARSVAYQGAVSA
jgi:DNA-directed RNA polymerase subunit omega